MIAASMIYLVEIKQMVTQNALQLSVDDYDQQRVVPACADQDLIVAPVSIPINIMDVVEVG